MLRLRIQHHTRYEYERPVTFGRHRLVLRPREGHDLRIEDMQLRIEPAHALLWVRDVFGNSIALVDFLAPSDLLDFSMDAVVQRITPFPARELHEPWRVPYPVSYDPMEDPVIAAYLAPSFPNDAAFLRDWLKPAIQADSKDAEGTLLALCTKIHEGIGYQSRSEKGVQNPAKTLQLASGSCRDMATLMMDAARLLGIAARFASGYLHGTASMAGHASTHAWTEVYLPNLGWRGFDPTVGQPVSLRHIVTGVSNHPRGVMPVSGVFSGTRADCRVMDVTVKTEVLTEEANNP